jgi:M6 family metalloprotease-like protein
MASPLRLARTGLILLLMACGGGGDPVVPTTPGTPRTPTTPTGPTPTPPTPVAQVEVQPGALTLIPSARASVSAVLRDALGGVLTGRTIVWTSGNTDVATVDNTGAVTAVAPGGTLITATSEGVVGSASVVVNLAPVASIVATPASLTLPFGGSATIVATVRDATGAVLTGRPLEWRSDAPSIASVTAAGVVTAIGSGATTIRVTSGAITTLIPVTVDAPAALVVEPVSATTPRGFIGRALADSLTVRVRTSGGAVVPNSIVSWSSTAATLSTTTTTTDAAGFARVRVVPSAASATVTATVSGAAAGSATRFDITARASGSCTLAPAAATRRFTLGPTDYTLSLRATDSIRIAVLFVDFPDAPATESATQLMQSVVTPGIALLRELSYGRTRIAAVGFPTWYRMPSSITAYTWSTYDGHRQYLLDVLRQADPEIDFSSFDALYVFAPPHPSKVGSPTFNGGVTANVVADGRNFGNAVTFGNDARTYGAAVVAHETGHMFGLLDLYDQTPAGGPFYPDDAFKFVGAWTLMSNIFVPGHYLMWEKRKLGFIDESQVDCLDATGGVEAVLTPNSVPGGTKMVAVPIDAGSALVIEARARLGLDASLCATGALVYTVDARISTGEGPAQVIGSRQSTAGAAFGRCGAWADGTFGFGTSPVASYTYPGVATLTVLGVQPDGSVRVRVTRP